MDAAALLASSQPSKSSAIAEKEGLSYDLSLLLVNASPAEPIADTSDETALLESANLAVQSLISQLFARPINSNDDGVMASLPPAPTFILPRAKPLPKAKPLTKWEKFAKSKGINKKKKDALEFDEEKQEWVRTWGYKGKNKQLEQQWLVEVPGKEDNDFNPRTAAKAELKKKKLSTEGKQQRNIERATKAALKDQPAAPVAPTGFEALEAMPRDSKKKEIERQLKIARSQSTASLGKYDRRIEGEGRDRGIKRKFDSNDIPASAERANSLAILNSLNSTTVGHSKPIKRAKSERQSEREERAEKSGWPLDSTAAPTKKGKKGEAAGGLVNVRRAIRDQSKGKGTAALVGKDHKKGSHKGKRK